MELNEPLLFHLPDQQDTRRAPITLISVTTCFQGSTVADILPNVHKKLKNLKTSITELSRVFSDYSRLSSGKIPMILENVRE